MNEDFNEVEQELNNILNDLNDIELSLNDDLTTEQQEDIKRLFNDIVDKVNNINLGD